MAKVIGLSPLHLLSSEQMPLTDERLIGARLQWFGVDNEHRNQSNPHPVFGAVDVSYHFNTKGYRCPEFGMGAFENHLTIVSIGASEVLGTGMPEAQLFSNVLATHLEEGLQRPVIHFNLGMGGASADYISRILASALPVLKPDIVLLMFPYYGRREHINAQGRFFLFNNQYSQPNAKLKLSDPENYSQIKANALLSSDYSDQLNFYKNYQFCESLCEKYKACWLFSAYRMAFFGQIDSLINIKHFVTPGLGDLKLKYQDNPSIGLARDMGHPGIMPHKEMAENLFERLKSLYFDRLGFG